MSKAYTEMSADEQSKVDEITETALIMGEIIQPAVGGDGPFKDQHEARYLIRRWAPLFEDHIPVKQLRGDGYSEACRSFLKAKLENYAPAYNWNEFLGEVEA